VDLSGGGEKFKRGGRRAEGRVDVEGERRESR